MPLPPDEQEHRKVEASSDDDTYDLSEPVEAFKPPRPTIPKTRPLVVDEAPEPPEPTGFPFLTGVFEFPFYLQTLAAWGMISIGLVVSAEGVVFSIYLVETGGLIAARCFALPVFLILMLSLSYTAACCVAVIETTAAGYDAVTEWPSGLWRDWFWMMVPALGMLLLAMSIGWMIGGALNLGKWLPAAVSAYLLFPIFVLSALEAGSPMVLVSWTVLRNMAPIWWGWLFFYAETGVLFLLWLVPTVVLFIFQPFVIVLLSAPVLAAVVLIYFRLIGRLAWCMAEYGYEEPED